MLADTTIRGEPAIASDREPVTRLRGVSLRAAVWVAVALALVAPIGLALVLAHHHGVRRQHERAHFLASEALGRVEFIRTQIAESLAALAASGAPGPCSPASLAMMRSITAANHYLAGLGYVESDHLRCSSFGQHGGRIPVGAPDYTSPSGLHIRQNFELPIAPGVGLLMATDSATGFASLTSPGLSIAIAQEQADVSVGTMVYSARTVLTRRGDFTPRWLPQMDAAYEGFMHDDSHLMVWKRSRGSDLMAYAAISAKTVAQTRKQMATYLVPLGATLGAGLLALAFGVARQQTSIRSLLKTGLRRNELKLVYQPIVDLQTGRWIGAEALVRWHRAGGELIGPDVFIPIAEKYGLMEAVTLKVIDMAAAEIPALIRTDPDFFVSINLSGGDFGSEKVLAALKEAATREGIGVHNLHVEATERAIIDTETVTAAIRKLRGQGFKVAIDDFGTGYSNLALLDQNTFDYLKIDKSFVDTIASGAAASQVIAHIIGLAREHDLVMIAEGVETGEQADYLREQNVQLGQGWLFGKPFSLEQFAARLRLQAAAQERGTAAPARQA